MKSETCQEVAVTSIGCGSSHSSALLIGPGARSHYAVRGDSVPKAELAQAFGLGHDAAARFRVPFDAIAACDAMHQLPSTESSYARNLALHLHSCASHDQAGLHAIVSTSTDPHAAAVVQAPGRALPHVDHRWHSMTLQLDANLGRSVER